MTSESTQPEARAQAPGRRLSRWAVAGRVAAIALVIVVMVAAGHYLRDPGAFEGDAADAGAAPARRGPAPAVAPAADDPAPPPATAEEATAALRRIMAGLIMSASDGAEGFEDPLNQDADARRRFLAERFRLPTDYPRGGAPSELAPAEAEVLVVFQDPSAPNVRMVLVRIRKGVSAALEDFGRLYAAQGWAISEPLDPKAQTDQGWLVQFTRRDQRRLVYARARQSGEETLAAIYDPRY